MRHEEETNQYENYVVLRQNGIGTKESCQTSPTQATVVQCQDAALGILS